MPPMFGYQKIANFEVYSYPRTGSYVLAGVIALLGWAMIKAWRDRAKPVL